MKFSLFKNARAKLPEGTLTLEQFMRAIKDGLWKKLVEHVRSKKDSHAYKTIKGNLPAVTISADMKARDESIAVEKRIKSHTGYICLDVDKKDNPKMRTRDLVDNKCLAQFVSAGGEGIKIIYGCEETKDPAVHRRIYDAAVLRLEKLGIKLKVDPVVKSIASLQYVSYDPDAYTNFKSKLKINALPPIVRKEKKVSGDAKDQLVQLHEYIDALGNRDITKNYEDWLNIMFGISYSLGESGREAMHRICGNYKDYSEEECDDKFDACLEQTDKANPITLATVYQLINSALPKAALKRLVKKYNTSHSIGMGEDITDSENPDLAGLVRYKLMLFKKIYDKEANVIKELIPLRLNLNAFEALLKSMGFYRYDKMFVWIKENIVEVVDIPDILRILTDHIQQEGDYHFTYGKQEYEFSWEEIIHKWREVRAQGTTHNQIAASLTHWVPNLLKDTATDSFIPYRNGVAHVTKKGIKLEPYAKMTQQIWKERILPRDFVLAKKAGMFEEFFTNVMGRGENSKQRKNSATFKRSLWYLGYMLQGTKRQSTARAWLLYDILTGNNGRSGKTIVGKAVGHIRSVTVIDGKRVDLNDRFAFQTVEPWTDVVFIDDPSKFTSLTPLFNMISGQTTADRKTIKPVVSDLKVMIASNWILEQEGSSESGRQFVSQLDNFYVRYAKEHKDTITPIVDLHGKEFFTDWDAKDWSQFDTFCLGALQYHLKEPSPQNTIVGNSKMMRFIQIHEEELFFALSIALVENSKPSSDGGTVVPQQVLSDVIKENNDSLKTNRAGKIAREYLGCIGVDGIKMTTLRQGGRVAQAYSFKENVKNLQFGHFRPHLLKH